MSQQAKDHGNCEHCGSPWEFDHANQRVLSSCDCAGLSSQAYERDNRGNTKQADDRA